MKISRLLFGTALVAGTAHLAATAFVRNLGQMPDPFQREELLHPTPGEVTWLERPDGTRLLTRSAGTGPAVVLAHGYGLTSASWNVVAERLLARGFQVISFDQRGHGESTVGVDGLGSSPMAADYRAVIDEYGVKNGVLVGHSMGAFLTLQYLLDHPDHAHQTLRGAVLVSPIHGGLAKDPIDMALINVLKAPFAATLLDHPIYGTAGLTAAFGTPSPSLVEALQAQLGSAHYSRISSAVDMMVNEDLAAHISEIDLPVSVIVGSEDRLAPPIQARLIAANLLHGELVWLDGIGHMVNWEAVDEIVRRVEERISVH